MVELGDKYHMDSTKPIGEWGVGGIEVFKQNLIHRLQNPPKDILRDAMMERSRKKHSWASTARGWIDEFNA